MVQASVADSEVAAAEAVDHNSVAAADSTEADVEATAVALPTVDVDSAEVAVLPGALLSVDSLTADGELHGAAMVVSAAAALEATAVSAVATGEAGAMAAEAAGVCSTKRFGLNLTIILLCKANSPKHNICRLMMAVYSCPKNYDCHNSRVAAAAAVEDGATHAVITTVGDVTHVTTGAETTTTPVVAVGTITTIAVVTATAVIRMAAEETQTAAATATLELAPSDTDKQSSSNIKFL